MKFTHPFSQFTINSTKYRKRILFLSFVIGLLSGLAAVLLKNTVHYTHHLITHGFDFAQGNYLYLVLPVAGIGLTVLFSKYVIRDNISHGVSRILYAISKKNGKIDSHNMYSSMIGSTFTIAFGGSMGLEAPIVLTGSAIGSFLGRKFHLNYKSIVILIGAGASGAIAGIFKAPITAVIFSLEVLMLDLTMVTLIPLMISSVTAATMAYFLMGPGVLFSFNLSQGFILKHLPYYIVLGILTGFVSLYFTRTSMYIETQMSKIKHTWQRWLAGSVLLSVLIYALPSLYGEGYEFLRVLINRQPGGLVNESLFGMLNNGYLILALGFIILFKVVAMALTGGSGGVGGIFAPSLFVGGVFGVFYARIVNMLPFLQIPEKNMALVGMAGVMAGVMHAPLTGIFLIAEFTGGYELLTPLIFTALFSYLTIIIFEPHSIYTKRLAQRGELMTHDKDKNVMQMLKVTNLIETDIKTINKEATLGELVKVIANSERNIIAVVDKDMNFEGIVFVNDIRNIMFNHELYDKIRVEEIMFMPEPIVSPDESMEDIAQKFQESGNYNLPVVKDGKYIGFVSRAKVFMQYRKLLKEFSDD
jgi:CIC family chloride channel protein